MSNPPNGYNTDASFNKFKGTYYNDDIDVSGGDIISRSGNLYLADNSSIFTSSNQIQFNEEFQFTDFVDNVNVLGQLKNLYNSVSYDVGLQCEKTDEAVADIATLSPIVSDTQFKTTGLYWDAGLSSTVFTDNVSFPNGSISSLAINNSSFVALSGAQTIDGIKTFNSPPVFSGASISAGTVPTAKITGTAVNLNTAQSITSNKTFTVLQNFQSIRVDGSIAVNNNTQTISNSQLQAIPDIATLKTITTAINYTPATSTTLISNVLQFSGTLNGWNTTNFSNAINYAKDLTSSAQTQINNINAITLSANNIFTGNQTYNGATTTVANTLASSTLTFSSSINGATKLVFDNVMLYGNSLSENIQTRLTSLATSITTLTDLTAGFYRSTTTGSYFFTSNLNTSGNFNTLTPYEIGNLTSTTEILQTAINNLKTKTDTTNINLALTTTNANDALQRTQEISFSDDPTPQTNITAKCVLEEVVFTTDLNDITPTTFGYLTGVSSNIQTQLNSKIDSVQGTIIQHVSANLQTIFPLRFLLCNGQNVSRTTYNVLFSIIGTIYGVGDNSSTFGIPDFQSCFLSMYSEPRTVNGVVYTRAPVGTIQQDSLEAHVHSSNLSGNYLRSGTNLNSGYFPGTNRPNQSDFPSFTGGVSSSHRTSTETRPLNHSVYFYITC